MDSDISLVLAGDFYPTDRVASAVRKLNDPADLLGPLVPIFKDSDLAIANLELPLTSAETPLMKWGTTLKGDPATISVLEDAGIGLVTLANNHTMDYGKKGLFDTLEICAEHNIATVGAGSCTKTASEPLTTTIKGRRIAFIGICENEFSVASDDSPGAYGLDLASNYYSIRKAQEAADIVIVLFHGGSEFTHYPSPRVVHTCRFFADVGCSAVVCHHPHFVQGYEVYKGVPILYSLGNLFNPNDKFPDMQEVPVAKLSFSTTTLEPTVHFDFFSISSERMKVEKMESGELVAMQDRFDEYCSTLESEEKIQERWDEFCDRNRKFYLSFILSVPYIVFRVARRLHMDHFIHRYANLKRQSLLCLEDFIRCEAHREAILRVLETERRS